MKSSRETLIKELLCEKTNTQSFTKENKLYFVFLHEDFYGLLFEKNDDFFISKFYGREEFHSVFLKKNVNKYQKGSFLTVKSIIAFLRSNNFSKKKRSSFLNRRIQGTKLSKNFLSFSSNFFSEESERDLLKKKLGFYFILDSIGFLLLCPQPKTSFGKSLTRSHMSVSLHKPLEFIERQCNDCSLEIEGRLFRLIHPEIVIRILRKNFHDISFFHLLRTFLHFHLPGELIKELFSKKIRNILWNIYTLEIDSFFVSDFVYSCVSTRGQKENPISLSFLEKSKEWMIFDPKHVYEHFREKNSKSKRDKEKYLFLDQSKTYKYVRTNMTWFIFLQREKSWSELLKRRILHLFVYRLGSIFSVTSLISHFIFVKFPDNQTSVFFLGYAFHFSKKRNTVKINTKFVPLIIPFGIRYISSLNPFSLLVFLLSRQNFCNTLGEPKAKAGWVTLSDDEIIQYFTRIRNSLFLFYSGCSNTKSLSRIQYILNLSCAKTLACKHKTSLREISKKLKFLSKKSSNFLLPRYSRTSRIKFFYANQKTNRVWDFHFVQVDSIFFHLDEFSNFVER